MPLPLPRRIAAPALALASLALAWGCASSKTATTGSDDSGTAAAPATAPAPDADTKAEREREMVRASYLIDPGSAYRLGYRIDWQTQLVSRAPVRLGAFTDQSVYILDAKNIGSRIDRTDGRIAWSVPVAGAYDAIVGIEPLPGTDERVCVLTESEAVIVDGVAGTRVAKQKLLEIAATAPTIVGQFLVYGARSGRLVWHSWALDAYWRAYEISPTIEIEPVRSGGYVVVVGADGRVMCLGAATATQIWSDRLLAPAVASPVVSEGVVFVASTDQYLRAYELGAARSPLWQYLTPHALVDSPVVLGDRVYQQAGGSLMCFDALPIDNPGGALLWSAEGVTGSIVLRRGNDLVTWDRQGRRLQIVDASIGRLVETIELPKVHRLVATSIDGGEILASGDDGIVIHLVPRG